MTMVRAAFIAIVLAILAAPVVAWQGSRSGNWQGGWTSNPTSAGATVTIAAMPYTRTVTCSDYTLTGTATGGAAVSWAASPSGASGACTGTSSWSCVVDVDPSSAGQGVEVITVTSGSATDTETIGFYVDGEHSCLLSQNVNGTYNSGLTNADAVATWTNLGSSAKNVTQGTGSAQPTFRTSVVGGQPVVRCDGGDLIAGASATNWPLLNNGNDFTVEAVAATSSSNPNALNSILATTADGGTTSRGILVAYDDRAGSSRNDALLAQMSNGTAYQFATASANDTVASAVFHGLQNILDEGTGSEWNSYVDGTARITVASVTSYNAGDPASPLTLCALGGGTFPLTGDVFRVLIYQSALTSTQRGINKAVDEWALGGTLPVTP